MSTTSIHREDIASVPVLEIGTWRHGLVGEVRAGARPVTLFGVRRNESVSITAVLLRSDGKVAIWRTTADAHHGYHALTTDVPAFHCFERELHEQTGVRVSGHPWLKPIRSGESATAPMSAYAYYKVDGKEIHEVAVGPIHAGVIEPGSFRFMCEGEQIHHLEIQLGYQNRGIEPRLLEAEAPHLTPLVETIAGDTSIAHAWAYCSAIEALAGCELAAETEAARAVALELERIAMHLSGLAGMAADIGHLQGATSYGRLRTTAINTTMLLCGSRFGRGALRPGGIRMTMPPETMSRVLDAIQLLRTDLPIVNDCFLGARTVRHRLQGVGVLTRAQASELGVVGAVARSSGIPMDARHGATAGPYCGVPIATHVFEGGDCWARARLRIAELEASLDWLSRLLAIHSRWNAPRKPLGPIAGNQLVIALIEGWRGEVVHCLETDSAGRLAHYKVQDPSLRNWMGLAIAVRHNEISDFPICNKSFDLSYCGNDL